MFDVIIVGAGVIGAAIARELSKYDLKIMVLEKANDIAEGTSKANSGIIHAGFDAKPNSLKGILNCRGNSMFDKLQKELDFPFKRNGSLVLGFSLDDMEKLVKLKSQGEKNGVKGLKLLNKESILKIEPNISENVVCALYAPTGGIICPYEFTIALCENAHQNGVKFSLNSEVIGIEKDEDKFIITTKKDFFSCKYLINAAGVHADDINNMISKHKLKILGRRGEYCLFDKIAGKLVSSTLFQLPTKMGKGVLVTQTVDGNLLLGPTALDSEDKDDLKTTVDGIEELLKKGASTINSIPKNRIITSFTGVRAHIENDDFIIEESTDAENFFNAAGIESPGLSSAPAIAIMICDMLLKKITPKLKKHFNPLRKGIPKIITLSNEERNALIKVDPSYGHIVCRCEGITEGEIKASINRPLGAKNLDGVKKRTRAMMGGCQGGFCTPEIVEILSKELSIPLIDVLKSKDGSNLLLSKVKEGN